jgi:hypothetical protein
MTPPSQAWVSRAPSRSDPRAGARRVVTAVFAAQGASVAAVSTTVPAVKEHFGLSSLATTGLIVTVALSAGAGSFAGVAAIRRVGPVTAMRAAVLLAAALLFIGWAPGRGTVAAGYVSFGLALGAIDVSANTRATVVERSCGRSVFASFYAAASAAGILAALITAGASRLGWSAQSILTAQAALVLALALTIRSHPVPAPADSASTSTPEGADSALGRRLWVRLVPFGLVLLIVYVIDSAVSAWSTVYLHQTLAASLAIAPLAYAAYQVGTVIGRSCGDHLVRRIGPIAMVRSAALLTSVALAGLASAPGWPCAILAAAGTGLGVAVLAPLCLAAAGRLRPKDIEAVLARLNLFNYVGVISGGAVSGLLGSTGHFRLAYAAPAVVVLGVMTTARSFGTPAPGPPEAVQGAAEPV